MLGKSKYYYLLSYHFRWTTRALVIAFAFSACGKKTCNPGSYIYEDQRVYKCFAEHAPSTATKKRLVFEYKKGKFLSIDRNPGRQIQQQLTEYF
ncbi:hypothetical protein [Oligoflexus tunisiensis]|uniref:hypothetical protein n=1 Tax=Oligoflexus tunisiensis TaxID=708132 RepID=UPI00114CF145|nr:hypothetical protein [Oligoflexus tunisiensis]